MRSEFCFGKNYFFHAAFQVEVPSPVFSSSPLVWVRGFFVKKKWRKLIYDRYWICSFWLWNFNILGDDIGFDKKTRIASMLSRGSQPRHQMTKHRCKHIKHSRWKPRCICSRNCCKTFICTSFCCLIAQKCSLHKLDECQMACYKFHFLKLIGECHIYKFYLLPLW